MSARFEWNGGKVLETVRVACKEGMDRAQIILVNEIKQQLNKRASNRGNGGIASSPGQPPAKNTGTLSRSWQTPVVLREDNRTRVGVRVGSNLVYARIHEYGGTVRPVRAKSLPVPIHPDAKRHSARDKSPKEMPGLVFIARKGKLPLLVRPKGKGKNARFDLMYVLVKQVRIPARPYVRPATVIAGPKITADLGNLIRARLRGVA